MSFLPQSEQTTPHYGIAILGMYRPFHVRGDKLDCIVEIIFRLPLV
jgi:hypothetical protein